RGELSEVAGHPFKPEGRIIKSATGATFQSAVDEVRGIVESLGLSVAEVKRADWPEYARLGLQKFTIAGEFRPRPDLQFKVRDIETNRTRSRPSGPFTTASLQQAAANQLRFSASRTMKTAQALYEGVDLGDGEGPVGLITYMRTDSTNLSSESV